MENNNPIIIKSAESLEAMNRADIDIQVKTAKSYLCTPLLNRLQMSS